MNDKCCYTCAGHGGYQPCPFDYCDGRSKPNGWNDHENYCNEHNSLPVKPGKKEYCGCHYCGELGYKLHQLAYNEYRISCANPKCGAMGPLCNTSAEAIATWGGFESVKPVKIEPLACFIGMDDNCRETVVKIAYKLNELIAAWNGRDGK